MKHLLSIMASGALLFILVLCAHRPADASPDAVIENSDMKASREDSAMQIQVIANGRTIVFELNDSQAARDLVAQLPLDIDVENYGSNEKIFYPPRELNTSGAPLAKDVRPGTLCYYAPWADVVMFYGSFGSAPGQYELGRAVQGAEHIRSLNDSSRIEADVSE